MRSDNVDLPERSGAGVSGEAARLVESLNSLVDGEGAVSALIACGPQAVEPLRKFLFEGRPGTVYQPRRWAVDALYGLGAKEILIAYLKRKQVISDPAVRLGEEAVENAAALHLASWGSEDVFWVLLEIALAHPANGIVEGLGKFGRAEALPYFIQALEDDCCRVAAESALRRLGRTALPALLGACLTRIPSAEAETASSLFRRASALGILAESDLPEHYWPPLRSLLEEPDPRIVVSASRIATRYGTPKDRAFAVRRLLDVLPACDWYLRTQIEDCLVAFYSEHRSIMDAELARRIALPDDTRLADGTLRTILRVKRRMGS